MALLVFVEFGGSMRARFAGYAGLALAGLALIALGTLCSNSTALGAAVMFVVGFAILFGSVLNGYVAAAQSAAILAFVLALMVPAEASEIGDRLLGWGIAAVLSTAAALLVWPQRPRSVVRAGAARAARALAEMIEGEGHRARGEAKAAAIAAIETTRKDFISMQHRPSGTGGRTSALARLIEDLGWVIRFATPVRARGPVDPTFDAVREEIEHDVPEVLRSLAAKLEGKRPLSEPGPETPLSTVEKLRKAHDRLGRATLARMRHLAGEGRAAELEAGHELDEAFRLRLLAFLTAEASTSAERALGASVGDGWTIARARLGAAKRLARAHASMRSVWLRNSLRGALGLALAVLIAQLAELQHAFWVVLGTLSVLRSSAMATGSTMWLALVGTFAGIVVGGALLIAVDNDPTALWILLPFATALAAYTPRAVSFAAGQAGFSIVVLILFNLIEPTGWKVGLLRIEDVGIGAVISVFVGLLFWPRGAVSVLRKTVSAAYTTAAAFLDAQVTALLAGGRRPTTLSHEAFAAGQMLDSGLRDYLSDRSGANAPIEDLVMLMAGATRVREIAHMLGGPMVLMRVEPFDPELIRVAAAARGLEFERDRRCQWLDELAESIAKRADPPPIDPPTETREGIVLEGARDEDSVPPGLAIAWAERYLRALREMEEPLARAARS